MKFKFFFLSCLALLPVKSLFSQGKRLTSSGIIEFQKSVNMSAILKRSITKANSNLFQPAYDQYVQSHPQFLILKSTLKFSDNKTLFLPDSIGNISAGFFGPQPMVSQNNIVYSDFSNKKRVSQKNVFDETFVLNEAIKKIKWKITGEARDIAGYNCYRANGIVMDSIYVVAFYSYEIPVSGGPESFNGLPGMILGLIMPHENISWFATRVTDTSNPSTNASPPSKGKNINSDEFLLILQNQAREKNVPFSIYSKSFLF
ncbi:GLPGLI family protein [Pedobacter sp. FW305-3-2-15-E-R2A2]|uniref:GLPGLI family protein n=1 Tax=Pedobacter sp. FW305-3-2-15-E-R2A2 TaxID=3140251 RepID=UPI003140577C